MGLLNRKTGAGASAQKAEKEIAVVNRLGLHARPEGPDAARALEEIEALINGRFNED